MRRYIESALRIRWRLMITVLVVFAIGSAALYFAKQGSYTSASRIWVDRTIYVANDPGTNVYQTPASVQAGIFGELLQTHQFALSVAQKAGIEMPNVAIEDSVVNDIQKKLLVDAEGAHLIRVSYTSNKPNYVKPVVDAAITLFKDETTNDQLSQAQAAISLYEQERDSDEKTMNASKDALSKYLQEHPVNPNSTTVDPTYTQLQQQYNTDRSRYDDVVAKIDDLNQRVQGKIQFADLIFRIMDSPSDAQPYQFAIKDLLRNSGIALALGIFAAIGLTMVATWTDSSIYTVNDISTLPLTEDGTTDLLVGVVPYVKTLGSMRRDLVKQDGKRRATKRGRGPSVSVVDEEPSGSGGRSHGTETVMRPVEALPDAAGSAGRGRQ